MKKTDDTPLQKTAKAENPLVLIVDDVEENVEILYSILEDQGFRFAVALNVRQLHEALERELPDLILLDVMLPDGNGFEVAEELKHTYPDKSIPIIFITARAHMQDKLEGFRVGGVDYITKPFEDLEVLARVSTHIELQSIRKEQSRLISELQAALAEVKQLRGIIPICANCKKVRDDKGYWMQVEHYLREHSDAEFSHSLCPDCMHKLYPDLMGEEES